MDIFWLIPLAIIMVPLLWGFFAYLKRLPESPSRPNVLVDKPSDGSPTDSSAENRDWAHRPCGSFMDWLSKRS